MANMARIPTIMTMMSNSMTVNPPGVPTRRRTPDASW